MIPSLAGFIFLFPASRPLPRFNLMEVVELERLCVMNRQFNLTVPHSLSYSPRFYQ